MRILMVCSGNTCRSPMAAALLAHRLESVSISSAGFQGGGAPASAETIAVMAARGVDLHAHRSTCLSPEMLDDFDLVLVMARRHASQIADVVPEALPKTFLLTELVDYGTTAGPSQTGQPPSDWLASIGGGRTVGALDHLSESDDVHDPSGAICAATKPVRLSSRS